MDATTRDPGRRAGFTLLEVVVALGVLAVGLLSLAAMQLYAMRGGNQGRHSTAAAAIAQTQMERLQHRAWANIGPTAGWNAAVTVNNDVQAPTGQTEQAYTLDWRITDVVANWTRAIDVRVRWDEPSRPNRVLTLSSLRFNREGP